ncbi:hypothetical protein BDY21DRAFT_369087 [Lineolata rhizophorae]|uniref:HMG box domain-containing protein n=1 Tax=Lineolata rhizophorae TaxID=578093 RepID=A0A6A6PAV7_9PEZI|nr:hypothetical protein BDY21DRAFT_369087 [Lineolata rhizophorae]
MLGRGLLGRLQADVAKRSAPFELALGKARIRATGSACSYRSYVRASAGVARASRATALYRRQLLDDSRSYATATKSAGRPARKKSTTGKKAAIKKKSPVKAKTKAKAKGKAKVKRATKPKRQMTPERIEAKQKKLERQKLQERKKEALLKEEPPRGRNTAYTIFVAEKLPRGKTQGQSGLASISQVSSEYKNLSASEKEHYNHLANEKNTAADAAYKEWVASHPAEKIRTANLARRYLRNMKRAKPEKEGDSAKKRRSRTPADIPDERSVKQMRNAMIFFVQDRFASGDFKGIAPHEAMNVIHKEYAALPTNEKSTYLDKAAEDKKRYVIEYTRTYGHAPATAV